MERQSDEVLDELHEVLQNSRYTASGKVQAITEVLYGPDGEYFEDFEEGDNDDGEEDDEEEDE